MGGAWARSSDGAKLNSQENGRSRLGVGGVSAKEASWRKDCVDEYLSGTEQWGFHAVFMSPRAHCTNWEFTIFPKATWEASSSKPLIRSQILTCTAC